LSISLAYKPGVPAVVLFDTDIGELTKTLRAFPNQSLTLKSSGVYGEYIVEPPKNIDPD